MPNRCQMISFIASTGILSGMVSGIMTVTTLFNPANAGSPTGVRQDSPQQDYLKQNQLQQNQLQQPEVAVTATEINTDPVFAQATQFSTTISGDPADIYIPLPNHDGETVSSLPIALMLPGALVERSQYSESASIVARYGFAVVVPSHERSLPEFNVSGELA